jgi:TonB-dependent SusC/RagA subfamily outer membrane receptor
MKFKTFKIMMSRCWREVMYSVSLLVLSMLSSNSHAQDVTIVREDRFQGMRARAYGAPYPQSKDPLIVRDAEFVPIDSVDRQCLDSLLTGKLQGDKEDIARLFGLKKDEILRITVLKDSAAIQVWGIRGTNGVVEVTTRKGAYEMQRRYSNPNNYEWEAINDEILREESRTELNKLPGEGLYIPSDHATFYSIDEFYDNWIQK